jgi:glycosyltransferase involved in cell wall biosynthesis
MFIHGNSSDYKNSKHYYDDIYTEYIGVSKVAAEKAIGYYPRDDIKYVYNPYILDENMIKPHLRLVTTMRSSDIKRPDRIVYLAEILDELDIPYTWNMFTDKNENTNVNGLIYRKRTVNPMPYVADSDYFVLLSDSESFSYSVVEALSVNTKVIVTPLEVYDEIGVEDGKNGFVVPFEYFDEENKDKLKEFAKKIYANKDMKFKYTFNDKLYEGFNDIFIK